MEYSLKQSLVKALKTGLAAGIAAAVPLLVIAVPPGPWTPIVTAGGAFLLRWFGDYVKRKFDIPFPI
jgi:VIT1/CCC1 family predicted Fe2+/Mn2+ transporter